MLAGSVLITATSLAHFDFETLPPFVIEKFPLKFESLWLAALRVHVASASLALPLCLLLLTRSLQRRRVWHRGLGRFVGGLVLLAVVPSGVVLSFDAKGGAVVSAGFLLSAAIVAGGMVYGILAARRRELSSHRRAMRHVVGQMGVAVTSRVLIVGLDMLGFDPELAYVVALWGPVLASAAVVELAFFAGRRGSRAAPRSPSVKSAFFPTFERIRCEVSTFAALVRARAVVRPFTRFGR